MNIDSAVVWLMALVPLSLSPGPANVLFAASGSAFGTRATFPFLLGTNIVCILQSLAVGLGLGVLIISYPDTAKIVKYVGVAVLFYLAFRFFRMAISTKQVTIPLSFKEGVVIELLNVKFLLIPTIMYSQFFSPDEHGIWRIIGLSVALAALTMASNIIWVVGGSALTSFFNRKHIEKYQGFVFGSMLCITAVWLAVG